MKPQVSTVVCTRNRARLLELCLRSLREQTLPPGRFEVIVIDNRSTDNTRGVVSEAGMENLRYVFEPQLGLSHARNRGLAEARTPYVAYIDDDARAEAHWLDHILQRFDTLDPKPVSIGGPILPWYEVAKPAWFKDEYEMGAWGQAARYLRGSGVGFWGSNMAWDLCALKGIGGFAPNLGVRGDRFTLGGEDTFAYRRLRETTKGEPALFYDPQIIVYHLVPRAKLSVRYRLWRRYVEGATHSFMEGMLDSGESSTVRHTFHLVRSLPLQAVRLVADVVRRRQAWQSSLVERGGPIAVLVGMAVASCRKRCEPGDR